MSLMTSLISKNDDRRLVHISSDSRKIAKTNLFQTPIDEIDAAARILESVLTGVDIDLKNKKYKKEWGKFLRDYRETEW